jgi:mannose-6-phosphate isomerase
MHSKLEITALAPFQLQPVFMEKIWGTADLRPWYDFVAHENPVGEVWLSGDQCLVQTGVLAGKTLGQVFAEHSLAMLGPSAPATMQGASPLLMKVIFATEKLSVQVHPDDRLAQKYGEPRGKTECWYVVAAEPDAVVATGLKPGVTLKTVEAEVADGTLEQSLELLPVTPGEMVFVDAGTVHAIWPGSVLLETQQNCDITYRLFDYGRPRELHVAKALEAIRLHTAAGKVKPVILPDRTVLVDREYFCVEKMHVEGTRAGSSMSRAGEEPSPGLSYLFAVAGSGQVRASVHASESPRSESRGFESIGLPARGMVAVPASSPEWEVVDTGGLELIRITPRWPQAAS